MLSCAPPILSKGPLLMTIPHASPLLPLLLFTLGCLLPLPALAQVSPREEELPPELTNDQTLEEDASKEPLPPAPPEVAPPPISIPATTTAPPPTVPTAADPTPAADPTVLDIAGPYRAFDAGIPLAASKDRGGSGYWNLRFGGYIRMGYRAIQDDPKIEFTGRNDGFTLTNARAYFEGLSTQHLGFRLQFEAAGALDSVEPTAPQPRQVIRPRDVFLSYTPCQFFGTQVGQFKPPHALEDLVPNAQLLFVSRSVGLDGVNGFDGRPVDGMAFDREMGVQFSGRAHLAQFGCQRPASYTGLGFSYAGALTNGSPASLTFNDNDYPAFYGRAALHWGSLVSLGGAAYFDKTTLQQDQDTIDTSVSGWTADLQVTGFGVNFLASISGQTENTEFFASDTSSENQPFTDSLAYQAQIGYLLPLLGIQPAYRFAYFDPTSSYNTGDSNAASLFENDALIYHTLGLNYSAPAYPIRLMLNYTFAQEQSFRVLENNRLEAQLQLQW